jgi:hypothetical protein
VSIPRRGAAEAAQLIASALDDASLPYAIGGALALAVAGVPRGTIDVDLNIFLPNERIPALLDVLLPIGVELRRAEALERIARDGMCVGRWDGMRIDLFLPSIPFAHEAERTRIRVTDAEGWSGWFLSAEAVAVFKLLFFRGKDMVDLERLVAVRPDLDCNYVRRWIIDMMGDGDPRTKRWDQIVESFRLPERSPQT